MSVSAKFYVLTPDPAFPQRVVLQPVVRGVENREWSVATPSGRVELTITNDAAREQFVPGEEYVAIFQHAPKPTLKDGHQPAVVEQQSMGKTYYVCGTCGEYARLDSEGGPDWTGHEERYSA